MRIGIKVLEAAGEKSKASYTRYAMYPMYLIRITYGYKLRK